MSNRKIPGQVLIGLLLVSILAGCTVGPDFKPPAAPGMAGYLSNPAAPTAASDSQKIVEGESINPSWWRELGSIELNALIDESLDSNPTLSAAEATLRQAQELYAARSGSTRYPQIEGSLGGQRQRFNPGVLGQSGDPKEFNLFNAGLGVRYALDLSGGNRRALEALAARSDYHQYQLEGARLTLAANIVSTAIAYAKFSMQIESAEDILQSQEEQLELTRERVRLGQASPDDVLIFQLQLEQTRASIPQLRNQLQQSENLLAFLAGRAPGTERLPSFKLEDFTLPSELPLIVPSELVRSRPDILGAEALLQAANADYGVAISKLYPQLNLSANLGSQALTTGALFGSGSAVWSLVSQLTQPLFNPSLPAEKRATLAAFDAAAANYRIVVLDSLRNVADVLHALENDAQTLAALSAADVAAQTSLRSMGNRYSLGATSYFELLTTRQQSQQIKMDLTAARAQCLVGIADFYQAMGGRSLNAHETLTKKVGEEI